MMQSKPMTASDPSRNPARLLVLGRIDSVTKLARYWQWVYALGSILRIVIPAAMLLGLADATLRIESILLRYGFSLTLLLVLIYTAWRYLYSLLRSPLNRLSVAQHIESRFGELKGLLRCAVEFSLEKEGQHRDSVQLREAVIEEASQKVAPLDLRSALSRRAPLCIIASILFILIPLALFAYFQPSETAQATYRLTHPWQPHPWPRRNVLEYLAAPTLGSFGEDLQIRVVDRHRRPLPKDAHILIELLNQASGDPDNPIIKAPMERAKKQLLFQIDHLSQSLRYRVEGGDDQTLPWIHLEAVPQPSIDSVAIQVTPPRYSGRAPYPSGRHIRALEGSHLTIKATSSCPLKSATLFIEVGAVITQYPAPLKEDGEHFHLPAEGESLIVNASGSYWFEIEDSRGIRVERLSPGQIHGEPDLPPSIDLVESARQASLTPNGSLLLRGTVTDDIAIQSIQLLYERVGEEVLPTSLTWYERAAEPHILDPPSSGPGEERGDSISLREALDLRTIPSLQPGDALHVVLTASDNKPQAGLFDLGTIQIISATEMRRHLERRQTDIRNILEASLLLQRESLHPLSDLAAGLPSQDLLSEAQQKQRQVDRLITKEKEGAIALLDWQIAQYVINRLEGGAALHRLVESRDQLLTLSKNHITPAEQQLSLLSVANDAEAEDSSPHLEKIIQHQQHIVHSLESLVREFSQRSDYQSLIGAIEQIIQDQQLLCNSTLALRDQGGLLRSPELEQGEPPILARRQGDLARRLEELLREALQLSEASTEGDRLAADGLGALYQRAQDKSLVMQMREAQRAIAANQLADAVRKQETLLLDLRALLGLIAKTRHDEAEQLSEAFDAITHNLRDVLSRLERADPQIAAWNAESPLPSIAIMKPLSDSLLKMENDITQDAAQLREALQRPSGAALEGAALQLADAANAILVSDLAGAATNISDTKETIQDVVEYLSHLHAQVHNQHLASHMQHLKEAIENILAQQNSILNRVESIHANRSEGEPLPRPVQARIRAASRLQSEIGTRAREWSEKSTAMPLFQRGLLASAEAMERGAEMLQAKETGEETQASMQLASEHLELLLSALKGSNLGSPIPPPNPNSSDESTSQNTPSGPTLAELQLVIELQAFLLARTAQLEANKPPEGASFSELSDHTEAAHALASLQKDIALQVRQWKMREIVEEANPSSGGNLIAIGEPLAPLMEEVADRLAVGETGVITQEQEAYLLAQLQKIAERARENMTSAPLPLGLLDSAGESSVDENRLPEEKSPSASESPTEEGESPSAEQEASPSTPEEILNRAWGDLPARLRQELPTPESESFLPGYEQLIEDYFRRLAEEHHE